MEKQINLQICKNYCEDLTRALAQLGPCLPFGLAPQAVKVLEILGNLYTTIETLQKSSEEEKTQCQ